MDELKNYTEAELRSVKDFTVYRKKHGYIKFEGETDIRSLDLDATIFIDHGVVVVYPESINDKPKQGEGLNKNATITLYEILPPNYHSSLTEEQLDSIETDYAAKLAQHCEDHGCYFVYYEIMSGSYIFKVDHFSSYGIPGSQNGSSDEATNEEEEEKDEYGFEYHVLETDDQSSEQKEEHYLMEDGEFADKIDSTNTTNMMQYERNGPHSNDNDEEQKYGIVDTESSPHRNWLEDIDRMTAGLRKNRTQIRSMNRQLRSKTSQTQRQSLGNARSYRHSGLCRRTVNEARQVSELAGTASGDVVLDMNKWDDGIQESALDNERIVNNVLRNLSEVSKYSYISLLAYQKGAELTLYLAPECTAAQQIAGASALAISSGFNFYGNYRNKHKNPLKQVVLMLAAYVLTNTTQLECLLSSTTGEKTELSAMILGLCNFVAVVIVVILVMGK